MSKPPEVEKLYEKALELVDGDIADVFKTMGFDRYNAHTPLQFQLIRILLKILNVLISLDQKIHDGSNRHDPS